MVSQSFKKKNGIRHTGSLRKEKELRLSPGTQVLLWFINNDKVQRIIENLKWIVFTLYLCSL